MPNVRRTKPHLQGPIAVYSPEEMEDARGPWLTVAPYVSGVSKVAGVLTE